MRRRPKGDIDLGNHLCIGGWLKSQVYEGTVSDFGGLHSA